MKALSVLILLIKSVFFIYFLVFVIVAVATFLRSPVAFNTTQNNFPWYGNNFFVKSTIWRKTERDENDVLRYHTEAHDIVMNKCSIIPCDQFPKYGRS